jgi:putative endonuclease
MKTEYSHYVYILASKRNGTLYIGVTHDLLWRVRQHKSAIADSFTKKYGINKLVYYEEYDSAEDAIIREKRLKKWNRQWKIALIEQANPEWKDLYDDMLDSQSSWE